MKPRSIVPGDVESDALAESMAGEFGLEPSDVEGLRLVLRAMDLHHRLGEFDPAVPMSGLAEIISMPAVTEVLSLIVWDESRLEPFLSDIVRGVRGEFAAGPLTVLAACAEARDDVLEAERQLRAAVAADPRFPQALIYLAFYEEDRGDYGAALRLYRTLGIGADQEPRSTLESLVIDVGVGAARVGRNEPCPCGSGRKYKTCHLGQLEVRSLEPFDAVLRKLAHWQVNTGGDRLVEQVEDEVRAGLSGKDAEASLDELLLRDVVLWDRGGLQRFLDVRGVLLPDEERTLLGNWLTSRRTLYVVTSVEPGSGVVLDEVDGSLEVRLQDRSLSRSLQPLDLFCTRLIPDESGQLTSLGGFSVPRPQRQRIGSLIASDDGIGLLRWLVDPMPTPHIQTMEGEELLFVTVTYRLPDPEAAIDALGKKLRLGDDGIFREFVKRRGREWIRGSISIDGDVATIESNAKKRADRLERTLRKAAPGATLLKRLERSLEQLSAEERPVAPDAGGLLDPETNPDVAAAMADLMREMEDGWVKEKIPALGGLTPRQAVRDPAWRGELEALLDDMTWQHRRSSPHGSMDPGRLRELLGLEQARGD
ncbi:MAG: SEC-C metal-binding domain-containing protein [Chloroflexota bacterium]